MAIDPFEILGLSREAGREEIKSAFRRLAKKYHPDITGGADEKFRRILLAYQQLSGHRRSGIDNSGQFDYYMKVEIDRERNKVQDLFDDFRDGFLAFFDVDAPEYLDLFLALSPEEAKRGGRLKLDLPLLRKCRTCYGFGQPFFMMCRTCGGTGEEEYRKTTILSIPEGTNDGDRARTRIDNLHLTVVFKTGKQGSDI